MIIYEFIYISIPPILPRTAVKNSLGLDFIWAAQKYYVDFAHAHTVYSLNFKLIAYYRRWVIKKVSEHNQDVSELIERESVLVKEIAEVILINIFLVWDVNRTFPIYFSEPSFSQQIIIWTHQLRHFTLVVINSVQQDSLILCMQKSKMNYRAWRHRCWLIPYMTREQVWVKENQAA